uniref:Uncharacterized protein n=1 Tax=Rhizophora mucronata TaxID=61149 RepID=A0A2P2QV53_RHIMU
MLLAKMSKWIVVEMNGTWHKELGYYFLEFDVQLPSHKVYAKRNKWNIFLVLRLANHPIW